MPDVSSSRIREQQPRILTVHNGSSVTAQRPHSAGGGFATNGRNDTEIIRYVLEGALAHKDIIGNGSVIRPGDVERMSARTGASHSEYSVSN